MMFLLDLAFAMELIALGVGIALIVWSIRNDGAGVAVSKFFGYIISIASVFALLCTSYYGTSYWLQGYFTSPVAPMMMMKKEMMKDHPMMMQSMDKMHQQHMKFKKSNTDIKH